MIARGFEGDPIGDAGFVEVEDGDVVAVVAVGDF